MAARAGAARDADARRSAIWRRCRRLPRRARAPGRRGLAAGLQSSGVWPAPLILHAGAQRRHSRRSTTTRCCGDASTAGERFGGDDVEIIVVEDGCRDGTAAFLAALARHRGARGSCAGFTRTTRTSCGARMRAWRSRAASWSWPGRTTCSCAPAGSSRNCSRDVRDYPDSGCSA